MPVPPLNYDTAERQTLDEIRDWHLTGQESLAYSKKPMSWITTLSANTVNVWPHGTGSDMAGVGKSRSRWKDSTPTTVYDRCDKLLQSLPK